MKRFSAGVLAAVMALAASAAVAQQNPNFSGDWKINQVKSNFGDVPAPDTFTRKIVHAEPSITIDEEQGSPIGVQQTQRKMTTDGKVGRQFAGRRLQRSCHRHRLQRSDDAVRRRQDPDEFGSTRYTPGIVRPDRRLRQAIDSDSQLE